ncbi:hypothetical protein R6Q57_000651 [Mikania cordata]
MAALRSTCLLSQPLVVTKSGSVMMRLTCMAAAGFGSKNSRLAGTNRMKRKPGSATYVVADLDGEPSTQASEGVDMAALMVFLRTNALRKLMVVIMERRGWNLIIQSLVEKVIMDSRFLTMLGVAGTLLGSVLCFLEGVFLVVESYLEYFQALYHHSDHGRFMDLLIKSLDMFLIGTAMLTFGMGLHVMFVGSQASKDRLIPSSNFFGVFFLKEFPTWAGMKSISQAKSKIGHALMLLLQVGVLEKFKSIPLVTGVDLASFAAAVLVSSAALFILSRLH